MKKYLIIPAIIIMAGLVSFTPDDKGYKYSTNEGHFAISFPGKPEESTDTSRSDEGVPFTIHLATYSPNDDEVYMTGWIDMTTFYPVSTAVKKMLENSRDGAAESMKATDVVTTAINLSGDPYIEFTFTAEKLTGKDRIYIINKFQYSIITIFSATKGIPPASDKFIGTFRHT